METLDVAAKDNDSTGKDLIFKQGIPTNEEDVGALTLSPLPRLPFRVGSAQFLGRHSIREKPRPNELSWYPVAQQNSGTFLWG